MCSWIWSVLYILVRFIVLTIYILCTYHVNVVYFEGHLPVVKQSLKTVHTYQIHPTRQHIRPQDLVHMPSPLSAQVNLLQKVHRTPYHNFFYSIANSFEVTINLSPISNYFKQNSISIFWPQNNFQWQLLNGSNLQYHLMMHLIHFWWFWQCLGVKKWKRNFVYSSCHRLIKINSQLSRGMHTKKN